MDPLFWIIALAVVGFILLVFSAVFLIWSYQELKNPSETSPPEKPELTMDASQLLEELLSSRAVVVVEVMDRSQIFNWAPKKFKGD